MSIAKCVFCGKEQEDYRGVYLMKNDGSQLYFSSSKCAKNFLKLKRDKRKIRWAEAFHITREKRRAKLKAQKEDEKAKKVEKPVEKKSSGKKV